MCEILLKLLHTKCIVNLVVNVLRCIVNLGDVWLDSDSFIIATGYILSETIVFIYKVSHAAVIHKQRTVCKRTEPDQYDLIDQFNVLRTVALMTYQCKQLFRVSCCHLPFQCRSSLSIAKPGDHSLLVSMGMSGETNTSGEP